VETAAVILNGPENLVLGVLPLQLPGSNDLVVDVRYSGISTGTEKLLWTGKMPPFPGMGYPLVPGYESAGVVVDATPGSGFSAGDWVFVPGANCFEGVRGLFGGAAGCLITNADRVTRIDPNLGPESVLLALAATARHALTGSDKVTPELIVGHGVLGRLLARITLASGAPAPTVWEIDATRAADSNGYQVIHPDEDDHCDYNVIYDASGDAGLLNQLIRRLAKGGELVLAGFYAAPISFDFPPAFMKEARLRIAAEWNQEDLRATRKMVEGGSLSLSGLITHTRPAADVASAYGTAFEDPACLKMILDWKGQA